MSYPYLRKLFSKPCQHRTNVVTLPVPLRSMCICSSGFHTLYSKQDLSRKISVFLVTLVLLLCDCVFQRGPSLCSRVLRTVCCYGLFPRGLCVHSSPLKIEPPFGKDHCAHMRHVRAPLSQYLSDSIAQFPFFPPHISYSPPNIIFSLCVFCLHVTSPFFFTARIPVHANISISVWHMIVAVKKNTDT